MIAPHSCPLVLLSPLKNLQLSLCMRLRLIWSRTHLVPGLLVPHFLFPWTKLSPKIWSPWTNGPQPIWSPWTNGPHQIWSPWTNGPQPIWSPYFQIITACPPGQTEYSKDHLSRETKLVGDYLTIGTNFWGPHVRGPYAFGTKCVAVHIFHFVQNEFL